MRNLTGKVAFVTGGASGIGLALARACGAEGMQVMLGDIDQGALDAAVESLRESGIGAAGVACDVTSEHSLRQAAQAARHWQLLFTGLWPEQPEHGENREIAGRRQPRQRLRCPGLLADQMLQS